MAFRRPAHGSLRLGVAMPIDAIADGFAKPVPATLLDLSEGGCRIAARSILLTNSKLHFDLPLPGRAPLKLSGSIKHAESGKTVGSFEYGVQFEKHSPADARDLQAFIARERENAAGGALRVETDFPIQCAIPSQREPVRAVALDVSRGGMRIEIDRPLPNDATIALRFRLPSGPELQVKARVLGGERRPRGEYHYSILYQHPAPAFAEEIARFIRAMQLRENR
jgi:c-di-GMP-binding flagellar brake protein YcgR